MDNLKSQIKKFLVDEYEMSLKEKTGEFILVGNYRFNLEYNGVVIEGVENIEIVVPKSFPNDIPKLFIKNPPSDCVHIYENKNVCLATIGELLEFLSNDPTLQEFIKKFIDPFMYTLQWYRKYNTYPFGDREHGALGLLNYYSENWELNKNQYIEMLKIVVANNYRGHLPCFCGSGKKMRNCHGERLLPLLKNESFRMKLLYEANMILEELYGKRDTSKSRI